MSAAHPDWPPATDLSNREREVAGLVTDGLTTRQIAHMLCISAATVRNHKQSAIEKCGLYDTRGLVRWVLARRASSPERSGRAA